MMIMTTTTTTTTTTPTATGGPPRPLRLPPAFDLQRTYFRTGPSAQLCITHTHASLQWTFDFMDLGEHHRLTRTVPISTDDNTRGPSSPSSLVIIRVDNVPAVSDDHACRLIFGHSYRPYLRDLYRERGILMAEIENVS